MQYSVRALSLGEILDESIKLIKNHFGMFAAIVCIALAPANLFMAFLAAFKLPHQPINQTPEEAERYLREVIASLGWLGLLLGLLFFVLLIIKPLTAAALTRAVASEYLGKPTTVAESWNETKRAFWPVIFTGFLVILAVCVAFSVIAVPVFLAVAVMSLALPPVLTLIMGVLGFAAALGATLYVAFKYGFASQVIMIEKLQYMDAMKRSAALMMDQFSTAFMLSLLLGLMYFILDISSLIIPVKMIQICVSVFIQAVFMAYSTVVGVVFYFSARCRRENFDLFRLAQAVAEEPQAAVQAS